ncbi:MAG: DNA mismatch repair protein MutS, partial [Bacteroidetes bacterium]
LDTRKNNYLASVHFANEKIGIAFLDISTGEFMTAVGDLTYIEKLLQSFAPSELIFSREFKNQYEKYFSDKFHVFLLESWVYHLDYAYEKLIRHFQTSSLKGFGIENLTEGIIAAGAIMYYLAHTEHHQISHITSISRIEEDKYVWLDRFTIRNLELIQAQQEGGVPLSEILDQTITPMGARLMRKWMVMPLKNLSQIQERLDTVDFFVKNEEITEKLMQLLKPIGDLERTVSKIAVGRINPREMGQLKKSLNWLSQSKEVFKNSDYLPLQKLADLLNPCEILQNKIEKELTEHLPILANLGNFVRENVDQELDELRKISQTGKGFLDKIQQQESAKTGIPSLKISFNHVFGYYLEVRNTHKDKVPNTWIRKQTLANAERYITEELKIYEEKILGAEEKILAIEQRIFQELVQIATEYINPIQQNAKIIAKIDALLSFAQIALKNNYVKPMLNESKELDIKNGRHPVIEQQLPLGEKYVPNDIFLDSDSQQILIITGPNMAGKSAIL